MRSLEALQAQRQLLLKPTMINFLLSILVYIMGFHVIPKWMETRRMNQQLVAISVRREEEQRYFREAVIAGEFSDYKRISTINGVFLNK